MVLEVANLEVKKEQQQNFERDFSEASYYISLIDGYIRHSLKKCIEKETRYILLVEWETLEDHEIGFRKSEAYLKWKELLHHYYDPFPEVVHYETVFEKEKVSLNI